MKKALLIATLVLGLVSLAGYGFAGFLADETVTTSVQVKGFSGVTLYEANGDKLYNETRDFTQTYKDDGTLDKEYIPIPGDTSWYTDKEGNKDDDWVVEPPKSIDPEEDDPAPSRITVGCVHNTISDGKTWSLKIQATKLSNGNGDDIDFTNEQGYANYGWVASSDPSQDPGSNLNSHTSGGNMLPYSESDETAYTSAADEPGAKIPIWTGIQIPGDQKEGTYTSTVTFTLYEN